MDTAFLVLFLLKVSKHYGIPEHYGCSGTLYSGIPERQCEKNCMWEKSEVKNVLFCLCGKKF